MPVGPRLSWASALRPLAAITLASVLLTWACWSVMPGEGMFPDVICYWSAADLLAAGQNPYDIDLQQRVQEEYGWDREEHGFGIYDFLPYYYPPWFGLAWVAFLPLGFPAAKLAWFFLNVELVLGAGYLLGSGSTRWRWLPVVLAPVFFF